MICCLMISQMPHVCVHLEFHPLHVGWDGLQGWWQIWRRRWCICYQRLLLILPQLLFLPWHAIFSNKWHFNWRPDELRRHDRYSVELVEWALLAWSHSGTLIHDAFFSRPGICIKLHDYFRIIFSHELCQLCPMPPSNFCLKFHILTHS